MSNTLDVSELFYSLQGEGVSLGRPAIFLRLSKCNLCCGCGDLVEKGKATWTCDSQSVMAQYQEKTPQEVRDMIRAELGEILFNDLLVGKLNLIITGGEPALYAEPLAQLLAILDKESILYQTKTLGKDPKALTPPTYEVETNGTIFSGPQQFYERFSFVNCSPKLESSGMAKDKRIVPFALIEISKHPGHFFKFVISSEKDWEEIQRDFIDPKFVEPERIFLMPAGATREEMIKNSALVWDMAMKHGMLATTRLHIIAFDTRKSI